MLRYAIIGFGGLGKIHGNNLLKLENERGGIKLCAIANSDLNAVTQTTRLNIGNVSTDDIDFSKYNLYTDYKELIDKEKPDFVVCALPTYLHEEVAVYALSHGADVYSEKPMAISKLQCQNMVDTALKYGRRLMIGQCLRFFNEYIKCREIIKSGVYGKVVRAEFSRKSPLPQWSFQNWMLDVNKSGGCIIDMHVHDVDVINWYFGKPKSVISYSTHHMAECESIYSTFEYEDKIITAAADWGLPSKFNFKAKFNMVFEKAFVEFENSEFTVYTEDSAEKIQLPSNVDYFYNEIKEYVDCILSGKDFVTVPLSSVSDSMDIVFAEIDSIRENKKVYI
jgi:predicted dehydrogenase